LEEVLRPLLGYLDDGPILSALDRAELRLCVRTSTKEMLPEVLLREGERDFRDPDVAAVLWYHLIRPSAHHVKYSEDK